jgi:signal transduction histidine kinase
MPSLRRSLIAYFLVLLAVALGGVSLIVHRVAADALDKRLASERARIQTECEYQQKQTKDDFNDKLLDEAERLGRDLRSKFALLNQKWDEDFRTFRLKMDLLPLGDLAAPGPAGLGFVTAFGFTLHPQARNALLFSGANWDNTLRRSYETGEHGGYFQLHVFRGARPYRPADQPFELPLEPHPELTDAGNYKFFTRTAPRVGPVHGVVYRTYLQPTPVRFGGPRGGRPPDTTRPPDGSTRPSDGSTRPPGDRGPGRGSTGESRPPAPQPDTLPPVYIQVARPQTELDERTAALTVGCQDQLAMVEQETDKERRRLRANLAIIAGVAFVGLVVGGWWLIGYGLAPLRKLSDAVSRVSEKDFRLSVAKDELNEELVPIHDRLTHSLDALRRAFEREKEAVADISHELRTPVAGLLATLDVALRKPRTADQYKQTLEDCRGITKQLGGLVERVMTLAYLDAGQTTVQPAPTDAADVAHECAAVIRPLATAHGLTFDVDADQPAELTTDPDKLREVMINLLHNAVEYNRPGGSMRLSVRPAPAGAVEVEVADTGIGMTPEVRGKIFERFYRADPSRTATGVHAGLGLAIVKEYVTRLGGTIGVESVPDRGSTFRVTLPADHPVA